MDDTESLARDMRTLLREVVAKELAVKRAMPGLSVIPQWSELVAVVRDGLDRINTIIDRIERSKPHVVTAEEAEQMVEELKEAREWGW